MPLLKYINREGNMELRTIPNTTPKIVYSVELEIHTWLSKCNMEFGCLGDVYAKSSMLLGEFVPQDELLHFVVKFSKAVDIPELCPPDVVLQIASHELSSEKAFLLLDWIRLL
ncbi:hypothetical protein TB2_042982 [Malus domestica]